MSLVLKQVDPSRGAGWVRDAFALYAKRPVAFTSLYIAFMLAVLFSALIPLAGALLPWALMPLVSLGFMVAARSARAGGPVTPLQLIEPLRGLGKPGAPARSLVVLCLLFGALALGIVLLFDHLSGHALDKLASLAEQGGGSTEDLAALFADPQVTNAELVALLLAALLSTPFWHAPALVHWHGQGVVQALFSSTVALWRCKSAFLVYMSVWMAALLAFAFAGGLLLALLGAVQALPLLALAAALMFQTVFYVSLIFIFEDSFGSEAPAA